MNNGNVSTNVLKFYTSTFLKYIFINLKIHIKVSYFKFSCFYNRYFFLGNIVSNNSKEHSNEIPIAKMAERVRLRRTMEDPHLIGTDITTNEVNTLN